MTDAPSSTARAREEAPEEAPQEAPEPPRPFLVIHQDASAEEVAAVVLALAASAAPAELPRRRRPEWNAPHRGVRRSLPHGPGGWSASALPR